MTLAPEPSSAAGRTGRRRPGLLAMLVPGVLLLGCVTSGAVMPAAAESADGLFERYELVTGEAAHRQTVLSGFFLGGPTAELVVVSVDERYRRRLRMYRLDGAAWVPALETTLGRGVLFVDVARIGGRDRLVTYQSGRLSWLDPDSATERALIEVAASYRRTEEEGGIPHVDITRDLNHDGRDDLILPDVDGFWITTQSSDGTFTDAVKLGPPEPFAREAVGNLDVDEPAAGPSRSYGEVGITAVTIPVYLSRVHEMDYDQDGRSDLVFWNEDHFDAHLQDERGRFDPVAESFTVDVPFDSEGVYSRAFEYRDQGVLSILFGFGEKTERTVLHSLRDLNGDQVADLVTLTFAGRSIARQRSLYQVHFGTPTPDGVRFARQAGAAIRPRGKAGAMQPWGYSSQWFRDFDGDGQLDVMFRDVAVGTAGMMRAVVGNSVPINLELYQGEDGLYPDKPTTRRRIRRFAPFAGLGNVFFPAVLMGDVNGDRRSDLVVGKSPQELHVFLGVPGPELLARQPRKVAVALHQDERNIWLADLDNDGRQDVLVYHPSRTEPHRLTTLIAR